MEKPKKMGWGGGVSQFFSVCVCVWLVGFFGIFFVGIGMMFVHVLFGKQSFWPRDILVSFDVGGDRYKPYILLMVQKFLHNHLGWC